VALRTTRWRYIQYADDTEELYDHERDPNEWHNLASDPEHRDQLEWLREQVPDFAPAARASESYQFDHRDYYWVNPISGQVVIGR
jgi:hypothetical protein